MQDLLLIADPDLVTESWLTAVLRHAGHSLDVTGLSHEPIGTGLMARSHRFHISGTGEGPRTLVLKFPSTEQATRQIGAGAYKREVGFYRDVAATVDAVIPICLHADVSTTGEEFVLVLEDIHEAMPGDQIAGCSPDDAHRCVANLARLHASTWGQTALARLPWIQDGLQGSLADYMVSAFEAFEPRFASSLEEHTLPVLKEFSRRFEAWTEAEPTARALVHGDYRLDNLMFSTTDNVVTTLDWQTVNYVSPGRDLAYFLGNSLQPNTRRSIEEALVDSYVADLETGGVSGYGCEQCWVDLRHGCFQGPLITMLGALTAERTARGDRMFATMADRCARQILDYHALDVLA